MVFDGKKEAEKLRKALLFGGKLSGKSLLIIQADGGSTETTYVRLKREMGESLGVVVRVEFVKTKEDLRERLEKKIVEDGVLVQLPIIGADRKETQAILDLIPEGKDVDGLTTFSRFLPAVVKAVDHILIYAWAMLNLRFSTAAVVGAEGTW